MTDDLTADRLRQPHPRISTGGEAMTAPPREQCTDIRGHFWRAVDSTRGQCARCGQIETFAADAITELRATVERQAREIAALRADKDAYHYDRAERAEAERDALRECVRAADELRRWHSPIGDAHIKAGRDYDAARAKVKP